MELFERAYGALLGLALGDALGFPALFHRTFQFPAKRREFLWRTNRDSARQRLIRLMLPFTHRLSPSTLEPFPTDDTEYTVFSAQALLQASGAPTAETFVNAWQRQILPCADEVLTGFSERAAIDNLRRGLRPPASGNDNPQHYDDSAAARAAAAGVYCAGQPGEAARVAELDAAVTQAEDGIDGARAMAAAIALLAGGAGLERALAEARAQFPAGSWIERGNAVALECLRASHGYPPDLLHLLITRLINSVYSYGNAAPETVPAALAIAEACRGELWPALLLANGIAKAADSLPALVGALCGANQGAGVITPRWRAQLNECRGLCLPFLAGVKLDEVTRALAGRAQASGGVA